MSNLSFFCRMSATLKGSYRECNTFDDVGIRLFKALIMTIILALIYSIVAPDILYAQTEASQKSVHGNSNTSLNRPSINIRLVSVASDGTPTNKDSWMPSISGDGNHIAFASEATNFFDNDTNNNSDIFVHELSSGLTIHVSPEGGTDPAISANGNSIAYVYFEGIFVHNRTTGETGLVSVSSNGTEGNRFSQYPSISADGRFVAFESRADNLVDGDTNDREDIFVHDLIDGTASRVSISTDGRQIKRYAAEDACISDNGRYVAFNSGEDDLIDGDSNKKQDELVHDLETGETFRVSVSSEGIGGNDNSGRPLVPIFSSRKANSMSSDGRFIAYESMASNLVPGDTNERSDVFVYDQHTKKTTRVSVASNGSEADRGARRPAISGDGRYVAFESWATNLDQNYNLGVSSHIYRHDRETGETILISITTKGEAAAGSHSPSISYDGRYVAFVSRSNDLVETPYPPATNNIFVAEIETSEPPPPSYTSPWPMFQHDPQHTGRSPYRGPVYADPKWAHRTQGEINSSPVIGSDGTVYIGSDDGFLYAINPDNGLELWNIEVGKISSSPAVASDGTIYVGSHNHNLYAIASSGAEKWRFQTSAAIESSPVIGYTGTIYFCSSDGKIYAISPLNGSERWMYETGKEILSTPAVIPDLKANYELVYVVARDGTLYDISSDLYSPNMDPFYEQNDIGNEISGSPLIFTDFSDYARLYIGSGKRIYWYILTYSFIPITAPQFFYSFDIGSEITSSPCVDLDGMIYVGCEDGLYAFDPYRHELLWHYPTKSPIHSSPAIDSHSTLYFGTDEGKFYIINSHTKTPNYIFQTNGTITSSPAIGRNEKVYIGSKDQRLYSFENVFIEEKQQLVAEIQSIERPISKLPLVGPFIGWEVLDSFFEEIENDVLDFVTVVSDKTEAGTATPKELQSIRRLTYSERVTKQATEYAVEFSEYWAMACLGLITTIFYEVLFHYMGKELEGKVDDLGRKKLQETSEKLSNMTTNSIEDMILQLENYFHDQGALKSETTETLEFLRYRFQNLRENLLLLDGLKILSEMTSEEIANRIMVPIMQEIYMSIFEFKCKSSQIHALDYAKQFEFDETTIIDDGLAAQDILNDMEHEALDRRNIVEANELVKNFDLSVDIFKFVVDFGAIITQPELLLLLVTLAEVADKIATLLSVFTGSVATVSSGYFVFKKLPGGYVNPSVDIAFGIEKTHKHTMAYSDENISMSTSLNANSISNQKIVGFFSRILEKVNENTPSWAEAITDSLNYYENMFNQSSSKIRVDLFASYEHADDAIKTYGENFNIHQMKSYAASLFFTSIELCAILYQADPQNSHTKELVVTSLDGVISTLAANEELKAVIYDSLQLHNISIPTAIGTGRINTKITGIEPAEANLDIEVINYGSEYIQGIQVSPIIITEDVSLIGDTLTTIDIPAGDTAHVEFDITGDKNILVGLISINVPVDYPTIYVMPDRAFHVDFTNASQPTPGFLDNKNIYAYPNPFNPDLARVNFRFSLSTPGNITIKVYDVSNQLVSTVISDYPMDAEEELSVSWDGRNDNGAIVANGTYFYIIESSSGERGVGKVAVVR